jgi:hypothetical protein
MKAAVRGRAVGEVLGIGTLDVHRVDVADVPVLVHPSVDPSNTAEEGVQSSPRKKPPYLFLHLLRS